MMRLVRFDFLLDAYVRRTFEELDGGFARNSAGEYVCGSDVFGSDKFGEGLEKFVLSELQGGYDAFSPDYFFVLGDCRPYDNVLLDLDKTRFRGRRSKYALAEDDIKIDLRAFNRRADYVFGRLFRRKAKMPANAFAVCHNRLGAGTLKAFMTGMFGRVNCSDMDERVLDGKGRCIVSANDGIEAATPRKSRLNSAPEAKAAMKALRQYVGECTGMDWSQ